MAHAVIANLDAPIQQVGEAVGRFNQVTADGLAQIAQRVGALKRANGELQEQNRALTEQVRVLTNEKTSDLQPRIDRLSHERDLALDQNRITGLELKDEKAKTMDLARQVADLQAALQKASAELAALKRDTDGNTRLVGQNVEQILAQFN